MRNQAQKKKIQTPCVENYTESHYYDYESIRLAYGIKEELLGAPAKHSSSMELQC